MENQEIGTNEEADENRLSQDEPEKQIYLESLIRHLKDINLFFKKIDFEGIDKNKTDGILDDLRVIQSNVEKIENLIPKLKLRIAKDSHFDDVVGNFAGGLQAINRMIEGNASPELVKDYREEIKQIKHYTEECVGNADFLKSELESEEGMQVH